MSGQGERVCLYEASELDAVLDRMASRAAGLLGGEEEPLLLGIQRRGEPLAEMLQRRMQAHHGLCVPRLSLKLRRYGDDLSLMHPETELTENLELKGRDLTRATLLVVDDVLYHGYSLVRTLMYLGGRHARGVHAAVLVDRCVAQFPVRASIVGIRLQVAPGDVVECNVPPFEPRFAVEVLRRGGD